MSEEKRLKINLELHIVGDGRTFMNYWNPRNGDDVITEVKNGGLYKKEDEISLQEFINDVKSKFD